MSNPRWSSSALIFCWCISLLVGGGLESSRAAAQDEANLETPHQTWDRLRLLFVPEAELPAILDGPTQRIVLGQTEVADLLNKLRELKTKENVAPKEFRVEGPEGFTWERASYEIELDGDVGRLTGHALGHSFEESVVSLPIPWSGGLLHRFVQNGSSPILYRHQDGHTAMLLSEGGKHQFQVEMTIPVSSDTVRQTVQLQLPKVAVGAMTVRVAGNVDLVSGAPVLERRFEESDNNTYFQLAAGTGPCELVFTLNNRKKQQTLIWDSRALILADVSRLLDRIQIVVENQVLQGQLLQAEWRLAKDWEVSQVSGEGVRQWQVLQDADEPRLQVWFHNGQAARPFQVFAFRQREFVQDATWQSPQWTATTATRQPRVIEITTTEDMLVPRINPIRMDMVPSSLAAALRQNVVTEDSKLIRHGSWYGTGPDSMLTLNLRSADDRFTTTAAHYMLLSEQGVESRSVFQIENQGELRFDARLSFPPGFRVQSVSDAQGKLEFQSSSAETGTEVRVLLRSGIGGTVKSLISDGGVASAETPSIVDLIVESEWVPEGWFANWSSRGLKVRPPSVVGAEQTSGVFAVGISPFYALKAVDAGVMVGLGRQDLIEANLATLEPNVAFDMGETSGDLELELTRKTALAVAESVAFYQLEPSRIIVRGEWLIDVRNGTQQTFRLQLPSNAPESTLIYCQPPHEIRQQTSVPDQPNLREIQFSQAVSGPVHLHVDFEVPFEANIKSVLQMEPLRVLDAAWQTQLVTVENNPRIDATAETNLPKWELERLPETIYQPARRLVGIWDATADRLVTVPLQVAEQQTEPTPTAVIESRELISRLAIDGTIVTGAKFRLKSTTGNLWLQLPAGAALWSLSQNGTPQTVQVTNQRIMISLSERAGQQAHEIQFVYRQEAEGGFSNQSTSLTPPLWHFPASGQASLEVPVLQTEWKLEPPPGLELRWSPKDWTVAERQALTWFERHGRWLDRQVKFAARSMAPMVQSFESLAKTPGFAEQAPKTEARTDDDLKMNMAEAMQKRLGDRITKGFGGGGELDPFGGDSQRPGNLPPMSANDLNANRELEEQSVVAQQPMIPQMRENEGGPPQSSAGVPTELAPPPPQKRSPTANRMQGFRSLQIQTEVDSHDYRFTGLGNKDRLEVQWLDQNWLDLLTLAVGCFLFAAGLLFGRHSLSAWLAWAAFLLVLSAAAQWLWNVLPEAATVLERMVWVVVLLVLWNLLAFFGRVIFRAAARIRAGFKSFFSISPVAMGLLGIGLFVPTWADVAYGQTFLDNHPGVQSLTVPDDAIIIPFDPALPQKRFAGRWLVPKTWFDRVQQKEMEDHNIKVKFPDQLFLPGGTYVFSIANNSALEVQATCQMELPAEQVTYLPLPLGGGALLSATVDGEPAILLDTNSGSPLPPNLPVDTPWLLIRGSGSKKLEFRLRFALNRGPGGWQAEGKLPAAFATLAEMHGLPPESRLTWSAGGISRAWTVPAEGVVAPLGVGADGAFSIRWREAETQLRVGSAAINHLAEIAVREAGVQVASRFSVQMVEANDELVMQVPDQWRVERIEGENLRAWNPVDGQPNLVLLQFLSAKTMQEFSVVVGGEQTFWNTEPISLRIPFAKVNADGLLSGNIKIFRSGSLKVSATDTSGLRRSNLSAGSAEFVPWLTWNSEFFGLQPFQAFDWQASDPALTMSIARAPTSSKVTHRSVLNFDVAKNTFETQITFERHTAPLSRVAIELPQAIKPESLTCIARDGNGLSAVAFQVAKRSNSNPNFDEYELRLSEFEARDLLVTIQGSLVPSLDKSLTWEPIRAMDATTQEYEYALTRTDTVELALTQSNGTEQLLPDEFNNWLDPNRIARLPISIRARTPEHRLEVTSRRLSPLVSFESVTDLTVGDRVIEETLLLEWKIERSGINQVEFLLPKSWLECQIEGPWIGRIERRLVDDQQARFTIFLQDRIVGDYRLAVTLDRPIQQTDRWATVPQNLTGETRNRWVTAQNSGNQELALTAIQEISEIQRQRSTFNELQQKIGATYLANAYHVEANAQSPKLEWRTVPRSIVETRTARVRLSETDLAIDREGRYVARQRLQVSNRTQPSLQLQLPQASQLIQLIVDCQSVPPLAHHGNQAGVVQIPLLKSSELNLDYPIELIYHGRLEAGYDLRELSLPLAFTVDVESEVSHLRLHLSPDLRPLRFGGTMTRVQEERVLQEEVTDYQLGLLSTFKKSLQKENLSGAQQQRQRAELEKFLFGNGLIDTTNPQQLTAEINELNDVLRSENSSEGDPFSNRSKIRSRVAEQQNKNEVNLNRDYSFNFANPLGESQQQVELGNLDNRANGQTLEKSKASRQSTNSRLSQAYQSDEGLQNRSQGGRGVGQSLQQQGGQSPQQQTQSPNAPMGGGLATPALPVLNPPSQQWLAPNRETVAADGSSQIATNSNRLASGLVVDFTPTGDVYYFRVPRGKPELTVAWTNQEIQSRFISTWQLIGAAVLCWVLVMFSKYFRRVN
ncbi:MAG: hypothetical protein JNL67_13650 [Planctomycetaceae bacterium]|nr:hypothetical protein [Planctomycetaceae bacterium]